MMEKSGCTQLTQEEFSSLQNATKGNATELVKTSAALDRLGMTLDEAKKVLDSGEYRIVEG